MVQAKIDRLMQGGIAALRSGDKTRARQLLEEVVQLDPTHEQGWLWLSGAVENSDEQIICLQNVLTINPRNQKARQALEKLGEQAPLLPDETAHPEKDLRLQHAPADAIGGELQNLITGETGHMPEDDSQKPPEIPDNESWRAALYEPSDDEGGAAIVKALPTPPERTLKDLFDVWIDMLIMNPHGGLKEEAEYGGLSHIFINVAVSAALRIIGVIFCVLMLILLTGEAHQPPLLRSIAVFGDTVAAVEYQSASEDLGGIEHASRVIFGTSPGEMISNAVENIKNTGLDTARAATQSLWKILAVFTLLIFPVMLIIDLYYGIVMNMVSGVMNAKRGVLKAWHAVSLPQVASGVLFVPLMFLMPFFRLEIAAMILVALALYEILVTTVSMGKVYKFDFREAVGATGISLIWVGISAWLGAVLGLSLF